MPDAGRCRVLLFTSQLGAGGAERHVVRLANHLDRQRFAVSIVVLRAGSYQADLAPDVELHVLGVRMRYALAPLVRLLRRVRPDVVLSTLHHANCLALAAAALIARPPPIVAAIQNTSTIEFRRGATATKRLIRGLIPHLYPRAHAVVALSRGVRDDLAAWIPRLRDRIEVIYNAGFDDRVLEGMDREEPDLPPVEGPLLLACGRLVPQKGYPHLLDAFARLRARRPATLWIAGDGPLKPALLERAEALGIARSVWFAGFRSNPYALMRRADIFVLPSLWEGFANVIVEAMAVGTPVVASDCPHGPGEIIRGEYEGALVVPGDAQALAEALDRVLRDGQLRLQMMNGGRVRAADFSAERIARQYGDLLLRAAGRTPRAETAPGPEELAPAAQPRRPLGRPADYAAVTESSGRT
jgi:glycosyltransferase involved in cell wall biosynthesis